MKVRLYAGNMLLNRKDEKKYVEIQKFDFYRKQNGDFFSSPNVLWPYGLFS